MRCFVAVEINDALRHDMINLQKEVAPLIIGNLVVPESLHFTLKFLGEIDDDQAEHAKGTLKDIADNFTEFPVQLVGLGAFPNTNYIRVLWVGGPALFNLQKAVSESLATFGVDREITPHLTIARVKNVKDKPTLSTLMEKHEKTDFGELLVSNIKLKKSTLTGKGPVYEDLGTFELAK